MKPKQTRRTRGSGLSTGLVPALDRGIDRAFDRAEAKLAQLVARSAPRKAPPLSRRQQLLEIAAAGRAACDALDRLLARQR